MVRSDLTSREDLDAFLDSNGDKIIEKNKNQVNPSSQYSFVTIKTLKNHGQFTYQGILIN